MTRDESTLSLIAQLYTQLSNANAQGQKIGEELDKAKKTIAEHNARFQALGETLDTRQVRIDELEHEVGTLQQRLEAAEAETTEWARMYKQTFDEKNLKAIDDELQWRRMQAGNTEPVFPGHSDYMQTTASGITRAALSSGMLKK